MFRLPALALTAALAGAAIACGGGGGGGTKTPAASPTVAQLACAPGVVVTPGVTPVAGPTIGAPPTVTAQPTTTSDGLQIIDVRLGSGTEATATSCVVVNYTGWLADGTLFDASSLHGGPYRTTLDQVITGWTEGVPGMKVGGTRRLIIPPALGYGAAGQGSIPANATLIFDIDLLAIP